ncbi:hypothetical protein PM082_003669 [Marasmius tenuissimus]|nr:hypothetical protein PM082_003669 [Marasmius tenuissimus]
MTQPAPYIQSIIINPTRGSSFLLPANFLGDYAPRLTSLKTRECNIPWGSPILRNLTNLHISGTTIPSDTLLHDIAATLQLAKNLESVDMSDFCSAYTSTALPQDLAIVLPHLKYVRLSSCARVIAALLQRIPLPISAVVELEPTHYEDALDFLTTSFSRLFSRGAAASSNLKIVKDLLLTRTRGETISLVVWNYEDPQRLVPNASPYHHFMLRLRKDHVHAGIQADMLLPTYQRLLGAVDTLEHLELLTIGAKGFSRDAMVHYFGNCRLLHAMQIYGACAATVIESFSPDPHAASQCDSVVYPALSTVSIREVNFGSTDVSTELIGDWLKRRVQHGHPIKEVTLETCTELYAYDVDLLKEAVGSDVEIDWDGVKMESRDADSDFGDF